MWADNKPKACEVQVFEAQSLDAQQFPQGTAQRYQSSAVLWKSLRFVLITMVWSLL